MAPICPRCMGYMLDIEDPRLRGWKKCVTCGYCHDRDGKNLLNRDEDKPTEPKKPPET